MADYQATLWAHDGTKWVSSSDTLIKASDGTAFLEPWLVEASDGSADWYICYPRYVPPAIPGPVLNLHATVVAATSITVAWDAHTDPTVTSYRYVMVGVVDVNVGTATSRQQTGLASNTTYTINVYALNASGSSVAATMTVKTGTNPPTITTWSGATYSSVNLTVTGDNPLSLNCVGGSRNGQTWAWNAGNNVIGGCVGTEYWTVSNAGGATSRFYTVAGSPAVASIPGTISNSYFAPIPGYGRGQVTAITWEVPPMAPHPNFPEANIYDGQTGTRWQTGNYPRGWMQFQIGVPAGYRVRRFAMIGLQTEVVTPVYTVNQGASWQRYSKGFGWWPPWDLNGITPGTASNTGLLGQTSGGSYDQDWNWRVTDDWLYFPYIPENATVLGNIWIYCRFGLVHLAGVYGANMVEVLVEYQTADTPGRAEVLCGAAWG